MNQNFLLDEYQPGKRLRNFPELETRINSYYDRVFDCAPDFEISPRYLYETGIKIAFRDIFFYIDQLYDNDPDSVIDVGCGECIWKKWFPNIVGFDACPGDFSQADFTDYFDEHFSRRHTKQWCNGMALNSLHFIDWNDIEKQLDLALNIVRSRFLFTFNFAAMKGVHHRPIAELLEEFYIRIKKNFAVLMFDCPLLRGASETQLQSWAKINGTVRFTLSA